MFLKEQVFGRDKTFALSRREQLKEYSLGQFEVSCYTEAVLWEEKPWKNVLSREETFLLRRTILVCVAHALRETGIWGPCDGWESGCLDRNVSGDFSLALGWRRWEESRPWGLWPARSRQRAQVWREDSRFIFKHCEFSYVKIPVWKWCFRGQESSVH